MIGREFFEREPVICARQLVGCRLVWGEFESVIVETEAYAEKGDMACHAFFRKSARVFLAEHRAGTAYIYFNYGVHWMLNALVKGRRNGFVLIRAVEPLKGIDAMAVNRRREKIQDLCSGPGKLSQAMGITGMQHGRDLCEDPDFCFLPRKGRPEVIADVRVGISVAKDLPWRFLLANSPFVSRKAQKRPD